MLNASIWEKINPGQPGIPATEKTIRVITLLGTLASVYQLYEGGRLLVFALRIRGLSPAELAWMFFTYGLLPLATVLFWWRRAAGWMLLTLYVACGLLGNLFTAWAALTWKPTGIAAFDMLRPDFSAGRLLVQVAVAGSLLYQLSRPALRAALGVGARQLRGTLVLAAVLGVAALVALGSGL